jgi:hypothetical protein
MGWFRSRSNRSVVTWLAFFALACQFLLSFGHLHVGRFSGGSAEWAATADASTDLSPLSPQKKPTGLAGDFCAICANINLVGAAVLPILALILIPGLFTEILHRSFLASELASFDYLPFSARGPPHA